MQPPKRLKTDARKKWLEIFGHDTLNSPLDIEMACQYCEAWADYMQARKDIEKLGTVVTAGKNGAPYQNPAIGTQNKALDQMRRLYQALSPKLGKAKEPGDFEDL